MTAPIKASTFDGQVVLRMDAVTANDIATALEAGYAEGFLDQATRPAYLAEVAMIRRAAAYADAQSGRGPEVVDVPLLRLSGGEGQC